MSNEHDPRHGKEGDSASDRALRHLFAYAEPREAPPKADADEIRAAVYAEWDVAMGRRVRWRRIASAAVAASVVSAIVLFNVERGPAPPLPTVAHVERLQGSVQIVGEDGGQTVLRLGDAIPQGAALSTGGGQAALRLVPGGSVRLAAQTRITMTASSSLSLSSGMLYFDSEDETPRERLSVTTSFGNVSDVGTQFFAKLETSQLQIGVRDGSIALARGAERIAAVVGEKLTVTGSVDVVDRDSVATYGDEWVWTERLAPPFAIDGKRLIDFLEWVAAQTGRTLEFDDAEAERVARETVLSGAIDLEPLPKLTAVMALTDLSFMIDGGTIVIAVK